MAIPIPILIVASVIASACTKLNAVVLGRPVSVSLLLVVAVAVLLTLAIGLLWILRSLLREGLGLSPYPRTVT
jgi:hypothetical protein